MKRVVVLGLMGQYPMGGMDGAVERLLHPLHLQRSLGRLD